MLQLIEKGCHTINSLKNPALADQATLLDKMIHSIAAEGGGVREKLMIRS